MKETELYPQLPSVLHLVFLEFGTAFVKNNTRTVFAWTESEALALHTPFHIAVGVTNEQQMTQMHTK